MKNGSFGLMRKVYMKRMFEYEISVDYVELACSVYSNNKEIVRGRYFISNLGTEMPI